jgi:uncharacterized membrane protein (UPF0127 family)
MPDPSPPAPSSRPPDQGPPAADPGPPPGLGRVALLTGGLLLVVAGVAVLAWVLASAAGLVGGGGDDPTMGAAPARTTAPAKGGRPEVVTYRLEPAGGRPVTVRLEVAADPAARARGLMDRAQVPEGTGMVFLYPRDVAEAYWMKNTLVPLSIAFVAADGRVVSLAEMTPCSADPCPSYPPAGPYRYAVELPAGAFEAAGVGEGDEVVPTDPAALPEPV